MPCFYMEPQLPVLMLYVCCFVCIFLQIHAFSYGSKYRYDCSFGCMYPLNMLSAAPMLKGTVRLIFQPAEEGGAGASHMIKDGVLDGVEAIFGMHVDYQVPTGSIESHPGPTQAAVCFFEAKIEGKAGEAAKPHLNVDPLVAASFAILSMQQLISREDDPLHSQVCHHLHLFAIFLCFLTISFVSPSQHYIFASYMSGP